MDEQTKQILELFAQPAFLAADDTILWCNSIARALLPENIALSSLLEGSNALFSLWSREGTIQIAMILNGEEYDVSICAMKEGDLFVATPSKNMRSAAATVLRNASAALRKPLQQLLSSADELFSALDPAVSHSAASHLNQSIYRLMRLCGQMSDGGTLLERKREAQRVPTDLNEFFADFAMHASPLIEAAGLRFHYQPYAQALFADIDSALFERALYNLISNAMYYTPPGGCIKLSVGVENRVALISVRDSGEGISPSVMSTLFDRFSEYPPGDSRRGIGLGLSMVREIARLHGGTVMVSSGSDGATVTLSISLDRTVLKLFSRAVQYDYCGEFNHGLVELSDVLSAEIYNPNEV